MRRAKAISYTAAIMLGGVMFLVGLVNMVSPNFGTGFLQAIGVAGSRISRFAYLGSVLIGTIYGVVQGLIVGCLFGLVYDAMMRAERRAV